MLAECIICKLCVRIERIWDPRIRERGIWEQDSNGDMRPWGNQAMLWGLEAMGTYGHEDIWTWRYLDMRLWGHMDMRPWGH